MNTNNNCIYTTYNKDLKKYLDSKNIINILYGLNPKTYNMFWVYERNELLNKELDNYYTKG